MLSLASTVLGLLIEHGCSIKAEKCSFFFKRAKFLGHMIDATGVGVCRDKAETIKKMNPKTAKELKSFVHLCSYYRKFIRNFSAITAPLQALIARGSKWKGDYSEEESRAVRYLKDRLSSEPILSYPDFSQPFRVECDASTKGIGACLSQKVDGRTRVIQYISRTTRKSERNYSQYDLEALALTWSCAVFRPYVIGTKFEVVTDNKAVKEAFKSVHKSGRLARWALQLMEYDFTITHRAGKKSLHVDALSRQPLDDTSPFGCHSVENLYPRSKSLESLDTDSWLSSSLGYDQEGCHSLMTMINAVDAKALLDDKNKSSPPKLADDSLKTILYYQQRSIKVDNIKNLLSADLGSLTMSKQKWRAQFFVDEKGLVCRKFHGNNCVYVPPSLVREVLFFYHGLPLSGHVSGRKLFHMIRRNFWWEGMERHCTDWTASCIPCIKRKSNQPKRQGLPQTMSTGSPFYRVAIDHVVGLTCTENENTAIFTGIDVFTRWPFACPTRDTTAETSAKALWDLIVSVHGPPKTLLSDRRSYTTTLEADGH